MTEWAPTDEQVEKAARVSVYNMTNGLIAEPQKIDYDIARAVLVAVGPSIAAQALRDAAGYFVWAKDDSDYAAFMKWLGRRADTIEKEAGR